MTDTTITRLFHNGQQVAFNHDPGTPYSVQSVFEQLGTVMLTLEGMAGEYNQSLFRPYRK